MNRVVLASIAAVSLAGLAATSAAAYDEIDARQVRQQDRIQQGVRVGEINRWEYRRLQDEQARIGELERQFKRDGHLDPRERAILRQAQDNASRHIYEESHDRAGRRFGYSYDRGWGWRPWASRGWW